MGEGVVERKMSEGVVEGVMDEGVVEGEMKETENGVGGVGEMMEL